MTFVETLQANRGELLRLKTQLWWYNGVGWDNLPGRVCLILDATAPDACVSDASVPAALDALLRCDPLGMIGASVLLLIDGSPKWVWIDKQSAEIITKE